MYDPPVTDGPYVVGDEDSPKPCGVAGGTYIAWPAPRTSCENKDVSGALEAAAEPLVRERKDAKSDPLL
jgi:hypothetical protein